MTFVISNQASKPQTLLVAMGPYAANNAGTEFVKIRCIILLHCITGLWYTYGKIITSYQYGINIHPIINSQNPDVSFVSFMHYHPLINKYGQAPVDAIHPIHLPEILPSSNTISHYSITMCIICNVTLLHNEWKLLLNKNNYNQTKLATNT